MLRYGLVLEGMLNNDNWMNNYRR